MNTQPSAVDIVMEWRRRLSNNEYQAMNEIVDMEGYAENCLGLTGWTTGFEIALQNYIKNIILPWGDPKISQEDIVANENSMMTRYRTEATHIAEFIGIAATGRRVTFDSITIVTVRNGRIVGQWVQTDLYGIYKQLTS